MVHKILVVDDELDAKDLFLQQFRREIRKGTYEILFEDRAQKALQHLRPDSEHEITILLSDINIPEMNGLELLEHTRAMKPDLPVMMITAYGDAATRSQAKELGALALLPKPVDFPALKNTLIEITRAKTA